MKIKSIKKIKNQVVNDKKQLTKHELSTVLGGNKSATYETSEYGRLYEIVENDLLEG